MMKVMVDLIEYVQSLATPLYHADVRAVHENYS